MNTHWLHTSMEQVTDRTLNCTDILAKSCICKNAHINRMIIQQIIFSSTSPIFFLLFMHPSIFLSIPFPWWVNFSPIACCLCDPDDPRESPNRLLLPIRIDQSTAPCQTRSIHHSFSNRALHVCRLFLSCNALLSFYYYFSQRIDAGKQAHCKPHHN